MEPEEIDKLFKNRLAGLPATPSPDAWLRLQQRMEPVKKERTMWVYYVAASISFLLLSGLIFLGNFKNQDNNQVAQTEIKKAKMKIEKNNDTSQATPIPNLASTSENTEILITSPKKASQKTSRKVNNEIRVFENNKRQLIATTAKTKKKIIKPAETKRLPLINKTENGASLALTKPVTSDLPESKEKNTFTPNNTTIANANVMQVVVKIGNETGEAEEENFRQNLTRKGALLKNIYLQARNLKNGDPVELASLGVDKEKINFEKENIKQKLNKVISF